MSGLHRADRTETPASVTPASGTPASGATAPATTPSAGTPAVERRSAERQDRTQRTPATQVPRTRVGAAWLGLCATALVCVVLIVFMLQNMRSTEVTFLGWHGALPLALALLIGSAVITMAIGTARITQLRRLSAKRLPPPRR